MRSLLLALGVLIAGACACSEEPGDAAGEIDLLARPPDEALWQAGELVPGPGEPWGGLGQFGWELTTGEHAGRPFVWTNRERAYLRLPACQPADRDIALELLAPGKPELEVRFELNGLSLGTLQVGAEPREQRLHAPQQLWLEGENLLALVCPAPPRGQAAPGVGVARVAYDIARRAAVDVERHAVRLEAGTSVRYRIEPLSSGRILLGARAQGAGTLEVALVPIDPATGEAAASEPQALAIPAAQDIERAYALPADGQLTELRVSWKLPAGGGEGAELLLRRLGLQEFSAVERAPIVLISVDTLSARHLSVYGYPLPTSPALERLAGEAHVFEHCLTNAPWTLPSFMSLMTGLYARAHQLDSHGTELWERWYLSQNRWTLAEFLRAAGYRTAGFVDNAWITAPFGFPQGFEVYDASAADNNTEKHVFHDGGIRQTTGAARAFLEGLAADTPFFLFVHCFDVHGPYTPPAPFDGRFDAADVYDQQRTLPAGGPDNVYNIVPSYIARGELPAGELPPSMRSAPIEGAYDAGVQFVDDELGKFCDYLRAEGWLERAWLIVTADHGETMADTAYYFGHGVMDQDVVQVPLIVRPPGGLPGGRRIQATVQLADLYPTVLDLLGSRAGREHLHGRSLAPFLGGGARKPSVVLAETGPMRQAMLVADGWKLIELELSRDIQRKTLLSYPALTPAWFERSERLIRTRLQQENPQDGRTPAEHEERLLGWKKDADLVRDFFEDMPRTGLTEELLARMEKRKGFGSLLSFLKRALEAPVYELYDLRKDAQARRDVAREFPEKLAEMKGRLEREKQRREQARKNARPPTQPVELSAESLEELEALGYGGEATHSD